jgi:DNA-binding Lrp family transcriptional regulator
MQKVKLSAKEQDFLIGLFGKHRPQLSSVGRRLNISKEMATYYYDRLESKGILKGIIPVVNYSAIGFSTYRLLVKLTPEAFTKKSHIITQLKKLPLVNWLIDVDGPHDIALLLLVRDTVSFNVTYEQIMTEFAADIQSSKIHIIQQITHSLAFESQFMCTTKVCAKVHVLDQLDEKIIDHLLRGEWKSLMVIAKSLKVSFNTIKTRVHALESHNVICGYKPIIDYHKLNLQHLRIMLDLGNRTQLSLVEKKLEQIVPVTYITKAIGPYDIEFECECTSVKEAIDIVNLIKKDVAVIDYQMYFTNKEIIVAGFHSLISSNEFLEASKK